ncbi:hypothetical protein ACJX0J_019745 [Zea mays]
MHHHTSSHTIRHVYRLPDLVMLILVVPNLLSLIILYIEMVNTLFGATFMKLHIIFILFLDELLRASVVSLKKEVVQAICPLCATHKIYYKLELILRNISVKQNKIHVVSKITIKGMFLITYHNGNTFGYLHNWTQKNHEDIEKTHLEILFTLLGLWHITIGGPAAQSNQSTSVLD